jgi:hypothetical protein
MTRGTIIVRNCSACGKYIMQQNIGSGITSHSRGWTDGRRKGPHLPEVAWLMLVKCRHCSALLWIEEQEEVCEIDPWGPEFKITDTFKDARLVSAPTFTEFITFLSTGVFDSEKERYIRLHAFWAGNDARRQGGQASPMTQVEKTNLHAFLPFPDELSDNDRFRKAVRFMRYLNRRQSTSVEEIPTH